MLIIHTGLNEESLFVLENLKFLFKKKSVYNVTEEATEHGIHCSPCSGNQ